MEKEKSSVSLLPPKPPPSLFGMNRVATSLLKGNHVKRPTPWPMGAAVPTTPVIPAGEEQKLESALAVESLVRQITQLDSACNDYDSSDVDSDVLQAAEDEFKRCSMNHQQVTLFDKSMRMKHRRYIETHLGTDLDSDDDDDEEDDQKKIKDEDFIELYRTHIKRKKMRKKIRSNPELVLNGENTSKKPEIVKAPKVKRRKSQKAKQDFDELDDLCIDESAGSLSKVVTLAPSSHRRKDRTGEKSLSLDQLNTRRRRLWLAVVRKEVGRSQKARNFNQKERLANRKRVATQCMRAVRQKSMISQRIAKETIWRAKRLTREMQTYWKRFGRVERQQKRQLEKEEEEQKKFDLQLLEAKRQQRKLNFLITQTELYAHFIANKIGAKGFGENEAAILNKLDEAPPANDRLAEIDDYDSECAKVMARNNAAQAMEANLAKTRNYDVEVMGEDGVAAVVNQAGTSEPKEHAQPALFKGSLKNYQLKGMNWLLNLYDQGINGILADEMGLGKTVQSLAMLASIAENYNIWGPFLVITPASTLHNWQQEVAKFLPTFKVVPYWGTPQERKTLRHFWDQANLHTQSASFHIVITSYQLVVTDFKYFNRIKWQYLVLDEAQAIKSSSSQRWKMLLEFKCRNRLLLSGTPIQNSMAELWSLLHFVMPTLFDSHEEFNDWFSKDIESSAENKSQIDEKQISRLHMILKPFMLRRIKKDVENELTDKLEILMYCPLTTRQKLLYMGLKKKIRIEDLLQGLGSQSQNSSVTTSLMNIVMQFRKVCNHPELFERREARSPFVMDTSSHLIPKLIFHDRLNANLNIRSDLMNNKFCIFKPEHVHRSLAKTEKQKTQSHEYLEISSSPFSFLRFVDSSPSELFENFYSLLNRWCTVAKQIKQLRHQFNHQHFAQQAERSSKLGRRGLLIYQPIMFEDHSSVSGLTFTSNTGDCVFAHTDVMIRAVPETLEHRLLRTRRQNKITATYSVDSLYANLVPEVTHVPKPDVVRSCQPMTVPKFLLSTCLKVATPGRLPYCYDRSFAWHLKDHVTCGSQDGWSAVKYGHPELAEECLKSRTLFTQTFNVGGIMGSRPPLGYSNIIVPDKETLISDAGKLFVLDGLLGRLKAEGHRVLIYSQMTKMIDLLEEYMIHRKHTFMRLDGSSKIHERRDMVADFQERSDIFVFLLSTRAGGLGINLTAADTVIFYDSDWNPTVDQQAMDRAHRLGQTKQVTVYRLICKGTIEERILQRAREKSAIQQMVIQGGTFKGKVGDFKAKEVVSLLLDDEEIERRYKEQQQQVQDKERKRKRAPTETPSPASISESSSRNRLSAAALTKKLKLVKEEDSSLLIGSGDDDFDNDFGVTPTTAAISDLDDNSLATTLDIETFNSDSGAISRDTTRPTSPLVDFLGEKLGPKRCRQRTGGKRGRPRGAPRPCFSRESSESGQLAMALNNLTPVPMSTTPTSSPSSAHGKRGPGRPRIKAGGSGGPLNQGNRGPPPKLNPGLLKA